MRTLTYMLLILLIPLSGMAQDFDRAEYFIDLDPGIGSGTPITLGVTASPMMFTTSIPTASLTPGFHHLGLRVRQSDGLWSIFEARGFYISTATTNSAAIAQAEYFVDLDPGVGSGTPISIPSGDVSNFTFTVPTTSLSAGFHFLAIRTKGVDGRWGIFEARGFYVSTATSDVSNIIEAEYFFDFDPGTGGGTPLSIPSGASSNFTVSIPTGSLAKGFHYLAIRTKGADGKWGIFESRGFYITDIAAAINIVGAEYFIDTDPGIGNALPLVVNPEAPDINQSFTIDVPPSLSAGDHIIGIRVLSADGLWSIEELDTIQVLVNEIPPVANAGDDETITLPVSTITLDGTASADSDGTIESFSWKQIDGPSTPTITDSDQALATVNNLLEGVYEFELTVFDDVNLSDRDTITITVLEEVIEPPPGPCVTPFITQTSNLLICNPPADSYQWYLANTPIAGATKQVLEINAMEFGLYHVETTSDTCQRSSEVFEYLITGSENPDTCNFFIAPNPVDGFLRITNKRIETIPIKVVDVLGKVVFTKQISPGEHEFDFTTVSAGQYYVVGESSTKPVLIKIHKR